MQLPDETLSGDIEEGRQPITLRSSLTVKMTQAENGFVLATHSELMCSGTGDTVEEALTSLRGMLAVYWLSFRDRPEEQLDAGGRELKRRLSVVADEKVAEETEEEGERVDAR